MLTGWSGWVARRALAAALFFAASACTPLLSAPPAPKPILETRLLVFPNKPASGRDVPPASDFRATVGNLKYEVRSVTAATDSSDLKTAVVFDLASVAPEQQPCLIQQARAMAPELRRIPNTALFVVSYERTDFRATFRYDSGETYEYFLPDPKAPVKDDCASPPPPDSLWWSRGWGGDTHSRESFRGFAEALQGERGPTRIIWVGQYFGWVHPVCADNDQQLQEVLEGRSPLEPRYTPNAAYGWLDALTRAGVSFWPVVWLNGESAQAKGPKINWKDASEIAQYLGGQASVSDRDLAASLKTVLDAASHGWIVRIAGPEVDWSPPASVKFLHLWYGPARSRLDLKRPFVRLQTPEARSARMLRVKAPPARSARILAWHTVFPSVPLFDSVWLSGKPGCSAGPGSETRGNAITELVPDAMMRGLRTYAEVLNVAKAQRAAVSGGHMQLRTRSAPQFLRETGQGTAEICVDLPPASQTDGSYRIVVFNPGAGWAGVGVVPVENVAGR